MSKKRSSELLDKSIAAMMAGIEIYNKPDFFYRDEIFSILSINAWELLLKSYVLKLNNNDKKSLYLKEFKNKKDGSKSKQMTYMKNRAGNYKTISINDCFKKLQTEFAVEINKDLINNIHAMIEIRDNSIHLINKHNAISKTILELGTASLKNYIQIIKEWFGRSLDQYNWFLLPIGFVRDFNYTEGINLTKQEQKLFQYISEYNNSKSSDYAFKLALELKVKRVRKGIATDIKVTNDPSAPEMQISEEHMLENYSWSYDNLTQQCKIKIQNFKICQNYHKIRKKYENYKNLCWERRLDPNNPKTSKKKFYNPEILNKIKPEYEALSFTT